MSFATWEATLRGLAHPVINADNEWAGEFGSSDPTKPKIKIESIYIHPTSHAFDPKKNYVGLIIYLRHGKSHFTLKGIDCRTGDIYIKETDWIIKNVQPRRGRKNYYHGRLFHSIFGCWRKKKLEFVGGGFSYLSGKWIFHSRTLNTINSVNNDDGYHNTNKALHHFEEDLIKEVCDTLYKNHCWLQLSPETRISLKELDEINAINDCKEDQCSADLSKVHPDRKLHGTVKNVILLNGYGFIECIGFDKDVFVHCSDVIDRPINEPFLTVGKKVQFNMIKGHRGWKAENVTVIN